MTTVRIGLLGCGVVGGAVARILLEQDDMLASRAGARLELARVAVRDPAKQREVELPEGSLTADPWDVVGDPSIDVVVETIGGMELARALLLQAIKSGKHVVTANKELLSTSGEEVMDAAAHAGVDLLFEGSVAGGIPIVRPMKESLAGDEVHRIMGILNGTTNFILTRMSDTGESFTAALDAAAALGYTEADPSADIEGRDAGAKLAILASLAFNARVVAADVRCEGIAGVTPDDVAAAHELGYEIKLLAVAERHAGAVAVRVHPAMLPVTHPLAAVRGVLNAVFVEAQHAGELMFLGRGAGGSPTASAVAGDLVEIVRNLRDGGRSPGCTCYRARASIHPPEATSIRYYVVLSVLDQPGVLASVAGVFARHGISIATVRQEGSGEEATLVLITHAASEGRHAATFEDLGALEAVRAVRSRMRVVGTPEG